jgi:hypothetical protein
VAEAFCPNAEPADTDLDNAPPTTNRRHAVTAIATIINLRVSGFLLIEFR